MRLAARIVFGVLLAAQAALVALAPIHREPLNADERYQIRQARYLSEHGSFPRAAEAELRIEHGAWGTSDWRPQGYPVFVRLCAGGDFEERALVRRVVFVQLALVLFCTTVAFLLIGRRVSPRAELVTAIVLGIAPWPFEFVDIVTPDSLAASALFLGLVVLARAATARDRVTWRFAAGSLLISSTLHLRPEMAALAPAAIAVPLLLRMRSRIPWKAAAAAAAAVFLAVAGLHYAYRLWFTGERLPGFYGGLHIVDAGPFHWANTWLGTEHEAYDFVYGLTSGAQARLPDRAFGDAEERRTIEEAVAAVRRSEYTRATDAAFERVASKRIAEHPISALVLPRLWHAAHLWLNVETNGQLLHALAPLPRSVRRAGLGLLLALKLALLGLFPVALVQAWRRKDDAMLVMGLFVAGRTLFVGLILGWMVHRYALMAWLPLLVCTLAVRRGNCSTTAGAS